MDIGAFKQKPFMGILRGIEDQHIHPLIRSVRRAGLETVEITMNTARAPQLINKMVQAAQGELMIGAGTVLNMDHLKEALQAGASFIVSPTLIPDVVSYCRDHQIPVFPGAFSPQEIYNAWQAGATMVKVFPAKFFGPAYIKEIKGPFDQIELLACGGVNTRNVKDFFTAGAAGIAFGGSIFKKDWLQQGDFLSIEKAIVALLQACK